MDGQVGPLGALAALRRRLLAAHREATRHFLENPQFIERLLFRGCRSQGLLVCLAGPREHRFVAVWDAPNQWLRIYSHEGRRVVSEPLAATDRLRRAA